jgi:hypothetical protein
VSVAFAVGEGVTVFAYDGDQRAADQWKKLVSAEAKQTTVGRSLPFRVECEPKDGKTTVTVKIAGKVVTTATVERTLDGPWGLGAQSGTSGIWRGVRQVGLGAR